MMSRMRGAGLGAVMLLLLTALCVNESFAARPMESLDRGIVAVRTGTSSAFISWRLLGLDPSGIGFNLYRSANGGTAVKLNSSVLTGGTNYTDTVSDFTQSNTYYVKPVIGGAEQAASGSFTLSANHATEPCVVVPLNSGAEIHFAWVGDLDGDGEYDFVIDRLNWGSSFKIEAYKRDGTFLWDVDYGDNSLNQNNIEGGSSVIDVGHWDGVTVYDLNNDGKAEVITKIADGVTFGDGSTWTNSSDDKQWIAVLDGMTGAMLNYSAIPTTYISDGPMMAQLGVGWDGSRNVIFAHLKNRQDDGDFNTMTCAYSWSGSSLSRLWTSTASGAQGHQIRICDVNGDGCDDLCHIGYALNGANGSKLYDISGVAHGDRWHIGRFNPGSSGMQTWGVQQDNSSGLCEFYCNVNSTSLTWGHYFGVYDIGRGDVGDIDPRYSGYEAWSFSGVYNAPSNTLITSSYPYPCLRLWWDGDVLSEQFNDGKIENWNYSGSYVERQLTTWNYQSATRSDRGAPLFYGDILGDWREELVMSNYEDYSRLIIFTSPIATDTRIYTLAHNPYYRNDMTVKGYMQSHHTDYYLGDGMSTPPTPDISYDGSESGSSITGSYLLISNRASGKAMDAGGNSNGSNVQIWTYWGGTNQQWNIADLGSSLYSIRSAQSGNLSADVWNWGTVNGTNIALYTYWGGNPQKYYFTDADSGYYRITPYIASAQCLDAYGTSNGSNIGTWSYWGGTNQQWSVEAP
ncbi:RICIN domain-containing protein [Candidatus Sumerlaeota bacterium]|nr:RICIN domain-containing protein [Candidatus Sumerlaeota bacterium]